MNFFRLIYLIIPSLLSGCAVGFDYALFMTKSNVGLDIDTKPPTAEISIARREAVIAPAFGTGQTPSVLAGFNTGDRRLFGFDISSIFAGGDAALTLTQNGEGSEHSDKLCLSAKPDGIVDFITPYEENEVTPFVFGTDTSFGLKVAWSGMTAQFPDSLKIGFNRKEMALAPIFVKENADNNCKYSVEMPAFLATIETSTEAENVQAFKSSYRQSFSTGKAAKVLAGKAEIKRLLLQRLDQASLYDYKNIDDNGKCIQKWANENNQNNSKEILNTWLKNKIDVIDFVYSPQYKDERSKFISDNKIKCN